MCGGIFVCSFICSCTPSTHSNKLKMFYFGISYFADSRCAENNYFVSLLCFWLVSELGLWVVVCVLCIHRKHVYIFVSTGRDSK